jgi:hypothetical protein
LAAALLVGPAVAAPAGEPGSLSISEKSFRCMTQMTHIGHFYVDNLVGNLDGTVRVAESTTGGACSERIRGAKTAGWSARTTPQRSSNSPSGVVG